MAINQSLVFGRWSWAVRCPRWGSSSSVLANDQGPTTNDLELLNRHLIICIDAHFARNLHCFFGDLVGRQLGVFGQGLRGRLGIGPSAADGGDAAVRLDHIP